jgi:hypothetical protein
VIKSAKRCFTLDSRQYLVEYAIDQTQVTILGIARKCKASLIPITAKSGDYRHLKWRIETILARGYSVAESHT